MRRYLPIFAIALILSIGLGGWLLKTINAPPETPMASLIYSDPATWVARPAAQPSPVWKDGWALDFLVFHPKAQIKNTRADDAEDLNRTAQSMEVSAAQFEKELGEFGAVYIPLWTDQQGEVAALSEYLTNDNNGRAFFIVSETPLLLSDLDLVTTISDANAASRFGGVIAPPKPVENLPHPPMEHPDGTTCSKISQPTCVRALDIDFRARDRAIKDHLSASAMFDAYETFLKESVAPMAEPLGDFEEVEIIDIRNPGDTDEQRDQDPEN